MFRSTRVAVAVTLAAATLTFSATSVEAAPATYTVVSGDSLFGISQKLKVRLPDLLAANGITIDSTILPGQQLVVPDAAVGSARIVAAVDGRLYIEATQANNLSLKTAWVYDVEASSWLEVGPLPPAGATRGLLASEGSPASGMTSFAVAP